MKGQSVADAPAEPVTPQHEAEVLTIQRNYRGYRARRQLAGLGLDASTRWTEAIKEAQFQHLIRPRPNRGTSTIGTAGSENAQARSGFAYQEWNRLRQIARRAGNDDTSDSDAADSLTDEQRADYRRKLLEAKRVRDANAKTMGIEYFLEMCDLKHRYGSHLRTYHAVWQKADTTQNFFYWLDQGEGKDVEAETCSREVLERDQVRYLTREQRRKYLVQIDKDGRLVYAKNGIRINTSPDFKDSLYGIVPLDDKTPAFRAEAEAQRHRQHHRTASGGSTSNSSSDSESSVKQGEHYVNKDLKDAKGVNKVQYISAAALVNHLLKSTTKKNTWIFVADTSFRLYVGIKQSGSFQHSSFLQGARISAAGVIKIKDGQLRSLSPLSGHYRPPTKNFRAFVHTLKERGVDMSRVNISKSYAVLLGVEGYMKSKSRAKHGVQAIGNEAEKVLRPDEARKREELGKDNSESAKKEQEHLARLAKEAEEEKKKKSFRHKLSSKLGLERAKSSSSQKTNIDDSQIPARMK